MHENLDEEDKGFYRRMGFGKEALCL